MPLNSTECTFNVFFVNEDGDEFLAFSHDLIIISARVTALDKHEYCPLLRHKHIMSNFCRPI